MSIGVESDRGLMIGNKNTNKLLNTKTVIPKINIDFSELTDGIKNRPNGVKKNIRIKIKLTLSDNVAKLS